MRSSACIPANIIPDWYCVCFEDPEDNNKQRSVSAFVWFSWPCLLSRNCFFIRLNGPNVRAGFRIHWCIISFNLSYWVLFAGQAKYLHVRSRKLQNSHTKKLLCVPSSCFGKEKRFCTKAFLSSMLWIWIYNGTNQNSKHVSFFSPCNTFWSREWLSYPPRAWPAHVDHKLSLKSIAHMCESLTSVGQQTHRHIGTKNKFCLISMIFLKKQSNIFVKRSNQSDLFLTAFI